MTRKKKLDLTAEDFAAWREDPTSQAIMTALGRFADAQKAAWERHSWEQGQADELLLCELRTRADAYRAMAELSFADLQRAASMMDTQ